MPLLLGRGVKEVIFEVQPPLVALMTESFAAFAPAITVVARDPSYPRGDSLPPFDAHIPLLSLPLVFGTEIDSVPTAIPYLRIAPARADALAAAAGIAGGERQPSSAWSGLGSAAARFPSRSRPTGSVRWLWPSSRPGCSG